MRTLLLRSSLPFSLQRFTAGWGMWYVGSSLGGAPHFTLHLYGSQVRKKGPKEILLISYEGGGKTSGTSWLLGNGSWGSRGQKTSRARDTQSPDCPLYPPTGWEGLKCPRIARQQDRILWWWYPEICYTLGSLACGMCVWCDSSLPWRSRKGQKKIKFLKELKGEFGVQQGWQWRLGFTVVCWRHPFPHPFGVSLSFPHYFDILSKSALHSRSRC